jgi:hypothetical protein
MHHHDNAPAGLGGTSAGNPLPAGGHEKRRSRIRRISGPKRAGSAPRPGTIGRGRPHRHLSEKSAKRRLARKATGSLPLWSSPVLRRSDGCDTVTRQASRGEVAEASEVRPPKLWAGATLGSRHLDWLGAFPDSTAGCAPHSSAGQWRTSQHSRHSRWRQRTAGVIPASLARVR